jgi:hypothetical protein
MDILRISNTDCEVEIHLTYGRVTLRSTGGTVHYGLHTAMHYISTLVLEPTYAPHVCDKS